MFKEWFLRTTRVKNLNFLLDELPKPRYLFYLFGKVDENNINRRQNEVSGKWHVLPPVGTDSLIISYVSPDSISTRFHIRAN